MRSLVKIFVLLLISLWLGLQLRHNPGYILIDVNHWTVEIKLWVAVASALIFFLLFHMVLVFLNKLQALPTIYRDWLIHYKEVKARGITKQGFIKFSEGYWSKARKLFIKALPDSDTPLLNYLTAARAAQFMGQENLRNDYLRDAEKSMPWAKISISLTQAELQLASHQWEQALATLKHLHNLTPKHPYVLKLLAELYQRINGWSELIAILPELNKQELFSKTAYLQLEKQAYLQSMSHLIKHSNKEVVDEMMSNLPKRLEVNSQLKALYCQFLLDHNNLKEAELILRNHLQKQYDDELIILYGKINISDSQLSFAESFIKKQVHSAKLYLCLGNLSVNNHLWGKANQYFKQSLSLERSPQAYFAQGSLYEQLNEHTAASLSYREGLALAINCAYAK